MNLHHSQLNQDLDVIAFYKGKNNGYFIDIGAYDGISLSNTFLLESKYRWNGICIEALPEEYIKLKRNRPHSICIQKAVFSKSDLEVEFSVADMYSGIVEYIDCHNEGKTDKRIIVSTIRLDDILTQYNAPQFIEYLSIDTEGSELEVLKSIDFTKYTFGIIHIEHNGIEPRRSNMKSLLLSKGYKYSRENQWDDEYIYPM